MGKLLFKILTCSKGGIYNDNNCLTCAINYIKEPGKNSSNCVENCTYLYYYNIFGQFCCTDDEQCPNDASLIIRSKEKCINICSNDNTNIYQYNGECLSSCPEGTEPNSKNICQLVNFNICTTSEFKLNLEETINEDNVKLTAKNYATEFYYTINHITKFTSSNFTMILYKNSSCIDELKLDITKIEYNSCIQKLKKDNNIDAYKELIVAIINIKNEKSPITSFGFFHPDTGEKLNATKSCSEMNVTMYENILTLLKEELVLKLLQEQKIDIFDLSNDFYNDICFHYESLNGKDATLQDRIKVFYPNVSLCNNGCKSKGIDLNKLEVGCECAFQDLLSKDILENELFRDNILIKETVKEVSQIISNLNLEVLSCYKDVFDFKYLKKNIGGFIILGLFLIETFCFIYFYSLSYSRILRYIYSLTEVYIKSENKIIIQDLLKEKTNFPPKKKNILSDINKIKSKQKTKNNKTIKIHKTKSLDKNIKRINKMKSKRKNTIKNSSQLLLIENKRKYIKADTSKLNSITNKLKKSNNYDNLIDEKVDLTKIIENRFEELDYDDVVDYDKRGFCEYFGEKLKYNHMIINCFCINEKIRPRPIKIAILILTIDLYFLINGLFYSDSYISEVFNSTNDETLFSFIPRSYDRFLYSTVVGNIIEYIIKVLLVDEATLKNVILKNKKNKLYLRYEVSYFLKSIFNKIKILIIINYIITIFSWYYLSCFNNVYPNIKFEWILSSILIILIAQILPFVFSFLETAIRFISIRIESEKLFKLSLLFP